MAIVKGFFGSQFSVSNSNLQVERESLIYEFDHNMSHSSEAFLFYESVILKG